MEHKQVPQALNAVLDEILFSTHNNAHLLAVLEAVAIRLQRLHSAGQFVPGLQASQINLDTSDFSQLTARNIHFAQPIKQTATPVNEVICAQQLACIALPDDFWRIFKHMYFSGQVVPANFARLADTARAEQRRRQPHCMRHEKDMWVWDEKSAQPMALLGRATKRKLRKLSDLLSIAKRVLPAWPAINACYKKLLPQAFCQPLAMHARVGVALHPAYWQQEQQLLAQLGDLPVLIRFYCHESAEQWQASVAIIDELHAQAKQVAIALVQDRQAVIEAAHWQRFVTAVIPNVHDKVIWCEVGHAINRVKWGIWTAKDYRRLFMAVYDVAQDYPALKLIAPAVIDFEWYRLLDALRSLPKNIELYAVSQHLYVDRRGAPENFQGRYSTFLYNNPSRE